MIERIKKNKDGLISLLVLLAIILVVLVSLLTPLLYHADRYRSELRRDMRVLQELRAIDAVQDDIQQALQSYRDRNLHGWIYAGNNIDQISLDVQRKVTPVIKPNTNETYTAVGVQVQFVAKMDDLFDIIQKVEQSKPLLVIDRMQITPQVQRSTSSQPEPPQYVRVQMTVQTYVATGAVL